MSQLIVKAFLYRNRRRSRLVAVFPGTDSGHAKCVALKQRINQRRNGQHKRLMAEWYSQ